MQWISQLKRKLLWGKAVCRSGPAQEGAQGLNLSLDRGWCRSRGGEGWQAGLTAVRSM